jgi:hypothetical protein
VLQKESKIGMLQMLIQPQYKRFYFVPDRQENWCFVSNSLKMLVAWAELKERSYGADCRIYTPENPTNKFANVWVGDCPPGFCMLSKQRLPGFLSGSGQSDLDLSVEWSNA